MTTIEQAPMTKLKTQNGSTETPATETDRPTEMIHREMTEDQICVLTFDRPDAPVNLFDRATLQEFSRHLNSVASNTQIRGLVIRSAKPSVFIAGADIHALADGARKEDVRQIIELGQTIFNRLADLKIPTVAAIHGACVGGGYEICLACDYRIASTDRSTKIGLPETMLGILPGWGGATRLPRLIGVPGALDIILAGKTVASKVALKRGMIDELAPRELLDQVACARIRERGKGLARRKRSLKLRLSNTGLVSKLIARKLRGTLEKKTRGHYPAILKALEVVTRGITLSTQRCLMLERDAVTELSQTEVCHNLIRLFFLQERAKKIGSKEAVGLRPVKSLAVIGAGVMGAGIAQWASAKNFGVVLRDINTEQVAKGMETIRELYRQGLKRHAFTPVSARAGLDRVSPAPTEVPLTHTDMVIEAAVEKMDLKKQIFARLDKLSGPETILATNTSALSITEIASATSRPERVVGIHFFNPVHRMQLVEVVVGKQTSPEIAARAVQFVQKLGKLPVVVKDSPGFLVNRILMPYLIEAGRLFEGGAKVRDIDDAMLDFGMPMGPLRLIDEVGVDVSQHVAHTLASQFPDRFNSPEILSRMIEAGQLGRKSGSGFYLHARGGKSRGVNSSLDGFRQGHQHAGLDREKLRTRMVLLMINEAARCLEEAVVSAPEDVDFGMVMGTGFAPFLGGPLRFADFVGVAGLVEELDQLVVRGESHFAPCDLLRSMAAAGKTFYPKNGGHAS